MAGAASYRPAEDRIGGRLGRLAVLLLLALAAPPAAADEIYQAPEDFLRETFAGDVPAPSLLWITAKLKPDVEAIMGHRLAMLRVRYWGRDGRTAWIIEEIGKYEPITTGIVVDRGRIERIRVLIYRESHGWEVRYPFFTDQFKDLRLDPGLRLSHDIDGISGATLSVNALTRLAALALYLHGRSEQADARD